MLVCHMVAVEITGELLAFPIVSSTVDVDGNSPFGMAYDPKNERMYVTNSESNTVSVIDTDTNTVLGNPIKVGTSPKGIAYDPENERMYVANFGSSTVSMIDTTSNQAVGSVIPVGTSPVGIAYDPVNQRMYTANLDNDSLSVIDTITNTVLGDPIKLGTSPKGIAYDPENERMYVTSFGAKGRIFAIDTNTNTMVGSPIEIGSIPQSIAYDSFHHRMYVTNYGSGSVSVVDTNSTNTKSGSLYVDAPYGLAYDHIKQRMYVSNPSNNAINIIETKTNTVLEDPIYIDGIPQGIAYDPSNMQLYIANDNASVVSVVELISLNTTIGSAIDGLGYEVRNGTVSYSDKITITFNETDKAPNKLQGYECSLDDSKFTPCISPQEYDSLEQGHTHIFQARTVDGYGNVGQSPATLVWQINKLPQTTNESVSRCEENKALGENDFEDIHNSVTHGNSIGMLTDPNSSDNQRPHCSNAESPSNNGIFHDGRNTLTGESQRENNEQIAGTSEGDLPSRSVDHSGFICSNSTTMSEPGPVIDREDSHCSINGERIQEQTIQKLPQISSQQFKQRTNTTTQNIPLSLPF